MDTIMFKPTVFKNGSYAPEFVKEDFAGGRFYAMDCRNTRLFFDKSMRKVADKVVLGTTFVAEVGEGCVFRLEDPYGGFYMAIPSGPVNISQAANLARPSARIVNNGEESTDWSVFCRSNSMCDENRLVLHKEGYELEMRFITHFEADADVLKKPVSGRRIALPKNDDEVAYVEFGFGVLIRLKEPNGTLWHLWTCPIDVGQKIIAEDIRDAFGETVEIDAALSEFQSNTRYNDAEELWRARNNLLFPSVSLPSGIFEDTHGPARQLRADPENNYWDVFTEGCVVGKEVFDGLRNVLEFGRKFLWPLPNPRKPREVSFEFVLSQPEFLGVVAHNIEEGKDVFMPKLECSSGMFDNKVVCKQIRVRFNIFDWKPAR